MTKLIILGCGSSLGSPWITNNWGNCNKKTSLILEPDVRHTLKGVLSINR